MKVNSKSFLVAGFVFALIGLWLTLRDGSGVKNIPQPEVSTFAAPQGNVSSNANTQTSSGFTTALLSGNTNQSNTPDGKDADSIRKWAHNELEAQRMLNENEKIYRRQLVTLKDPVAAVIERNRLTGARIRELTLQGLDGSEIQFEVTRQDIEPSGLRGTFYGRVAGRLDSMVTLAYLNTRQAYTILSPADNLYLDAEPHDPGDVIVKSINLEKYGSGLCGNN